MSRRKIRFGIIGCGTPGQNLGGGDELHARYNGVGWWHAMALEHLEDAELVAASSRRPESVAAFAGRFHVRGGHTDYRELLDRDDVDVVNVCTPSAAHAEIAGAAAQAGKHVILEKPMDIALEPADRIIDACRAAGVKLQVCLPHRLGRGLRKVKEA